MLRTFIQITDRLQKIGLSNYHFANKKSQRQHMIEVYKIMTRKDKIDREQFSPSQIATRNTRPQPA